MTIYRIPDLWCDGCPEHFGVDQSSGDAETPQALRDEADAVGWAVDKATGKDLCPSCAEVAA